MGKPNDGSGRGSDGGSGAPSVHDMSKRELRQEVERLRADELTAVEVERARATALKEELVAAKGLVDQAKAKIKEDASTIRRVGELEGAVAAAEAETRRQRQLRQEDKAAYRRALKGMKKAAEAAAEKAPAAQAADDLDEVLAACADQRAEIASLKEAASIRAITLAERKVRVKTLVKERDAAREATASAERLLQLAKERIKKLDVAGAVDALEEGAKAGAPATPTPA